MLHTGVDPDERKFRVRVLKCREEESFCRLMLEKVGLIAEQGAFAYVLGFLAAPDICVG